MRQEAPARQVYFGRWARPQLGDPGLRLSDELRDGVRVKHALCQVGHVNRADLSGRQLGLVLELGQDLTKLAALRMNQHQTVHRRAAEDCVGRRHLAEDAQLAHVCPPDEEEEGHRLDRRVVLDEWCALGIKAVLEALGGAGAQRQICASVLAFRKTSTLGRSRWSSASNSVPALSPASPASKSNWSVGASVDAERAVGILSAA
eukprot:scaffold13253_cov140-Isochrysis_galbana.AAC.3